MPPPPADRAKPDPPAPADQRALYEHQSRTRGDMRSHFEWYAPRRRLEDTVAFAATMTAGAMLEVGCGDGVLLAAVNEALAQHSRAPERVVGLDLSSGRLARARERVRGAFACASAEALPLAPATFDLVVFAEVLEHVLLPHAALAEMRRVLRPGGRMLLSVPVVGWSRRLEALVTGRVRFLDEDEHVREFSTAALPRCETIATLKGWLAGAGFEVVRERGVYAWPHRGERLWHALLSSAPLRAPARALDRALAGGPLRHAARWLLIEARAT